MAWNANIDKLRAEDIWKSATELSPEQLRSVVAKATDDERLAGHMFAVAKLAEQRAIDAAKRKYSV